MGVTDWQFFWGRDDVPGPEEMADAITTRFDRLLWYGDAGFALLEYGDNGIAWIHTWVAPAWRGRGRFFYKMIRDAVEQARTDGRRKLIGQIIDGNPWYPRVGKKMRGPFGFAYEATLKKHIVLGGVARDLHLYTMFLDDTL